ncbi:MAG: hypothetical protein V1775_03050 [Bacteroidota bacterium]
MNQKLKIFTRQLLMLATLTGLVIVGVVLLIPPDYVSPALPFLLVFFTAATILSFYFLQKKLDASPSRFVTAFMANAMIRLMLYLAIIVIYALTNRPDSINFIVSFFILYLIFSTFEVSFFLRKRLE